MPSALRPDPISGFTHVVGIGGIGTGVAFQLEGDHTLGREESRPGALLPSRDFCKLHIVEHSIAAMMGATATAPFRVAAIGVVGNDAAGATVVAEMNAAGIDTAWVRKDAERPTLFSVCYTYPDRTGGNITASNSAAAALSEADIAQCANTLRSLGKRCIALCLPEVPLDIRHKFLNLATECENFRAASLTLEEIAAARKLGFFSRLDLLALNQEEASAVVGYECTAATREGFLADCVATLTALQPTIRIVMSAGGEGAYGFANGAWSFCPAPRVPVASTAGAGDALLGGVLAALAAGLPLTHSAGFQKSAGMAEIDSALELGVLLASFSVTSPDAIHFGSNLDELEKFGRAVGVSFGKQLQQALRETAELS